MTDTNTNTASNNTETTTTSTEPDEQVTINTHENVSFFEAAGEVITTWDSTPDQTTAVAGTPDLNLASFLARPILIHKLQWTDLTGSINFTFKPWADLLSHLSVQEKIKHFALMKSTIRLRFVVNGSPFYYGRLIVGMVPFEDNNIPWGILKPTFCDEATVSYLSQNIHGFIDPATNSSFEMSVPFLSIKNWARIYGAAVSEPQDFIDVQALPSIVIREVNQLRIGNTGTDPLVNISVFAWFDNPELAIPTSSKWAPPVSEGPKRDKEQKDSAEGKSTISGIATAFSNSLSMLKSVPVIGPFAMAGSIAAGATANIAKMFGFSRPMLLAEDQRFMAQPITNTSATQGTFSGYKMSVDPMQGLSVDPRIASCSPSDDLSIAGLATRESFLTKIGWSPTNVPGTSFEDLFQTAVTPLTYSSSPVFGADNVINTPLPCCFAATPFRYWKGTMVYKFQVVASQYHRGKVAIIYEPNMSALISIGVDYNNHISAILDIQDLDNFEFVVPWRSEKPMLKTGDLTFAVELPYTPNPINPFFPVSSLDGDHANGFIRIVVVNELVGATSPCSDVTINVYARCDDLEVAYPRVLLKNEFDSGQRVSEGFSARVGPSTGLPTSEGPLDTVQVGGFDKEEMVLSPLLGGEVVTGDNFKVVCGENILSFRTLLKRFNKEFTSFIASGTHKIVYTVSSIYPDTTGYLATTASSSGIKVAEEFTTYGYLKYAFLAVRGGYRRVSTIHGTGGELPTYFTVHNFPGHASTLTNVGIGTLHFDGAPSSYGGVITPLAQNQSISFETPSYTSARYAIGLTQFGDAAVGYADTEQNSFKASQIYDGANGNNFQVFSCAAADDFSLSGFIGCPPRITLTLP